ncbi:hypothetical protein V2J09_002984 [Rumex salicifolius]
MAPTRVYMEVGSDGVAVITFSNPPVNALALSIYDGLEEKFNEAMRRNDVKAIVVTGEGGKFCGGFDINVFGKVHKTGNRSALPNKSIDFAINLIEEYVSPFLCLLKVMTETSCVPDGKKPYVAAIQGLALGGGLELAMACHARIAAPKTQLGLPELTLGIIPGMGGTQRLPRLVGLPKAIEMMLTSKPILSEEGNRVGLIDAVVSPGELLNVARLWALDIAEKRKPWRRSLHLNDKIGSLFKAHEIIMAARKHAKQMAKNLPQHLACLDAIEDGVVHGGYSGGLKEGEVFRELVASDTSKGLVHSFFSQRMASKVPGVTDVGLKPRQVKKVAVIGGGLMGSGIATSLILSNYYVLLKEINSEYLSKGIKMIQGNLKGLVTRGKLTPEKAEKALSLLKGVLDYNEFKDVDMVIEAVIEKISLKQSIFCDIENICPPHCILATNTSTIDLDIVGEKTNSQDRVIGAHFFSPAHIMPLLEIIRTDKTSPQVILDLMTVGKAIKKVPVVVGNCTGFAVNRNFFPYSMAAQLLVNLGVDPFRIDKAITDFGMPIGPFQLQDLAGYGVAMASGKQLATTFSDRVFGSPLLELLIKSGRNGKNNGKGYYTYEKGSKPEPDLSIMPIVEESRRITNIMPGGKVPILVSDREIVEMVLFPVVNEACRVLDEGIVIRSSDLDVASILGMGFPSYRGGIVFWADMAGPRHVYQSLKKWSDVYVNSFFKPSRYLEERAAKGIPLSSPSSMAADSSRSRFEMEQARVILDVGTDGVALITFNNPPVNALALTIFAGLEEKINEAISRNDVKAIVLTGENGIFCGGFDINVFEKIHKTGDISILHLKSLDFAIDLIEDAKKPFVVAIEGLALGGGLELAMACHARISAPKAQLGLPELSLGLIPGMGGTQRLPRLVGVQKAVEMMLSSKPISSEEGNKLGLIDAVVPRGELLKASRLWALDIVERRKPWTRSLHSNDKIGSLSEANKIILTARKHAKKIARNTPQHLACLDVIEWGIARGGYDGCLKEAKVFKELVTSDTSKGLVHSFFSQRMTSKIPGVTDIGIKPRPVSKVAVIGGGLMGSGIATSLILCNRSVILKEINSEYLLKGIKIIQGNVNGLVKRGKLTPEKAEKALSLLKGVLDYNEFKDVDLVIEAVIEKISLKQSIFSEIEKICPPNCILASNTSTIDLNIIGEKTSSMDRVVGTHFFSPAHVMPLLEIVRTDKTSPQVILDLMTVCKAMKKVPIVVGSCTGFATTRCFFPYGMAAQLLINLGVDPFRIDKAITEFGMPIGPIQLQDVVGYRVNMAAGKEMATAYSDRTFRSPLLQLLIDSGRDGKNNGKGYYLYEKNSKPKPDLSIMPIVEESRRITNIMPSGKPISVSDEEIVEMVFFPVVNEACRVMDEGVVVRSSDLDVATILGMSFPSYRGGLIYWADTLGARHIYESMNKWSDLYGKFFKPSRYLEERATKGIPLSVPGSTSSASSRSRL